MPINKIKSYKLEAPDGGWGILVCIGMAMPFVSGLAALPSFGLIFGDFLKSIGAETSAVAFITSAFFCSLSFAGLFSGSLFRRWGLRPVGLIGGFCYFIGSTMQAFVVSTMQLTIAFSVVQGVGFGLIVPTAYTTFNNYFVKNRVMWMSFAQSLIGLGSMVYPILMQKLLVWYGFRGCLLILAAINAHAVLGMLLMQPVEWHMRRVPIDEEELQLQQQSVEVAAATATAPTPVIPILQVVPETPIKKLDEPKFISIEDSTSSSSMSPSRSRIGSRRLSRIPNNNEDELKAISSRASSITSLGNWSGPVIATDASPQMMHSIQASRRQSIMSANGGGGGGSAAVVNNKKVAKKKKSICRILIDFLDLTLLKQPIYVNIVLGITFALYSDITFFTMQPIYLFELGFSKFDTSTIIAIGAAADLISRIFLAVTAIFVQVPSRYIYLAGAGFTVFARIAFNGISDFVGMASITAVMGFLRTWIHVPLPLVFADYLPQERFASGYGLFMFTQGNIMFLIGPIVGYIRDRTGDYIIVFHILNLFMALCPIPWIIELLCVQFRRRNKIERNNVCEHIENGTTTVVN